MENNGNKKGRAYWKRILTLVVSIFALIGLLCMFLCAINPLISPDFFILTSFFGLTFWPILFTNLLILIALIVLKARWKLLVPIVAIVIAIPGFMRSFSIRQKSEEKGNIKIMSYNIAQFRDITDNQRDRNSVEKDVVEIINAQNPDIVCLQESGRWDDKLASDFAQKIGCKYYSFEKGNGNVIFSKYPIDNDEFTERSDEINNLGLIRLVDAGKYGKFYLECVHLQSFMITKDEIEYINDAKSYVEKSETVGKSLIYKLKDGFRKRTADTKIIMENLPENFPIIICGDFNDTPQSYTYHQMRKAGLVDAFLKVDNGVGKTYCGSLPLLRIDYFWCSKDILPKTFDRVTRKMSDHYPIIMTFDVTR